MGSSVNCEQLETDLEENPSGNVQKSFGICKRISMWVRSVPLIIEGDMWLKMYTLFIH